MSATAKRCARPWLFWGTYDTGKPRTRLLLDGVRETGIPIVEVHADVWRGIEDKSQIIGLRRRLWLLIRWLRSYPLLIVRFLSAPRPDVVVIPYMGHVDTLVLWPFARLRRVPVVLDFMLPLHEAVVLDRGLAGSRSLVARLLWTLDSLALRASDLVVVLSEVRTRTLADTYDLPRQRFVVVRLGAETTHFRTVSPSGTQVEGSDCLKVLFYGQFAPMHGLRTVVEAAKMLRGQPIDWTIVGTGHDDSLLRQWLEEERPANVHWIDWVPYDELGERIAAADLCLGLFGTTAKAQVAIPNKIYQAVAVGRAIMTANTEAVRELLSPDAAGVYLVDEPTRDALSGKLRQAMADLPRLRAETFHEAVRVKIHPAAVGREFVEQVSGRLLRAAPANVSLSLRSEAAPGASTQNTGSRCE